MPAKPDPERKANGSSPAKREVQQNNAAAGSSSAAAAAPAPAVGFRDIPLYSLGKSDWNYHSMKFASHSAVEPSNPEHFTLPIKLNRKFPPRPKIPQPKPGDVVLSHKGKRIFNKEGKPLVWPDHEDPEQMQAARAAVTSEEAKMAQETASASAPGRGKRKGHLFQKRVREVHKASDIVRQTRQEEFFPWILEDFETSESWESARKIDPRGIQSLKAWLEYYDKHGKPPPRDVSRDQQLKQEEDSDGKRGVTVVGKAQGKGYAPWIGRMEGEQNKTSHHVFFVLDHAGSGAFRVVPVQKTYKFLQRPKYSTLSADQAEEIYAKQQKTKESTMLLRARERSQQLASASRSGSGASTPRILTPARKSQPAEDDEDRKWAEQMGVSLPGRSAAGPRSGRSVATVEIYSEPIARPRRRAARRERIDGDDEMDYTEEFADDDERMDMLDRDPFEDEEARELEQRLRDDMRRAEQTGDDGEEDEYDDRTLTGTGKQMKKIMKALGKREGNEAYDSDEENPYAEEESDDENLAVANPERALEEAREERLRREKEGIKEEAAAEKQSASKSSTRPPSRSATPIIKTEPGKQGPKSPQSGERARSPTGGSIQTSRQASPPPGAGHATAAHRATSPNRVGSSGAARGRVGSPGPSSLGPGLSSAGTKRKSDIGGADHRSESPEAGGSSAGAHKKPRTSHMKSPSPTSPSGSARGSRAGSPSTKLPRNDLEAQLIEFLKRNTNVTTSEIVKHFRSRATGEEGKALLSSSLKRVAITAPHPTDPNKKILVLRDGF